MYTRLIRSGVYQTTTTLSDKLLNVIVVRFYTEQIGHFFAMNEHVVRFRIAAGRAIDCFALLDGDAATAEERNGAKSLLTLCMNIIIGVDANELDAETRGVRMHMLQGIPPYIAMPTYAN
jgi:hypothetical protein